jgi:hypothetical protein
MSSTNITRVYDNLLAYLVEKATPEEILAYTIPEETAQRAIDLMERNSEGTLTPQELDELEEMRRVDKLIALLKARSLSALKQP